MSIRTRHLNPGDQILAPQNLDWEDDEVDWVLFNVVENIKSDNSCVLTVKGVDGRWGTVSLNPDIGICLIEK